MVNTERTDEEETTMMAKESLYIALSRLRMVMLLLTCVSLHQAAGHTQTAQQPSGAPSQPMQVSLAHLYWHFLIYQNYLDTGRGQSTGAKLAPQRPAGKDAIL